MAGPEPVTIEDHCYYGDCREPGEWLLTGILESEGVGVCALCCSEHMAVMAESLTDPWVSRAAFGAEPPSVAIERVLQDWHRMAQVPLS